jgi:hypothetical protein
MAENGVAKETTGAREGSAEASVGSMPEGERPACSGFPGQPGEERSALRPESKDHVKIYGRMDGSPDPPAPGRSG